jgi:DedD protein
MSTGETRLKERLTGAAILVALVVMLVPEMFHGQRGDVAASAGSSGEGPPVRSYTIDLSNGPTRTAPLQSTPANAGGAGNDDKPASAPPPPQSTAPASVPAADAATAARTVTAAAATPTPVTATAAPRAAPPAVSANPRQPATAARNPSSGGWAVQLGLFAKRDNAERLVHSAQAKGFAVSVSKADAKGLYRVYAGGMADRSAAEAFTQRLKDQGLPAAVIAAP